MHLLKGVTTVDIVFLQNLAASKILAFVCSTKLTAELY